MTSTQSKDKVSDRTYIIMIIISIFSSAVTYHFEQYDLSILSLILLGFVCGMWLSVKSEVKK